MKFRINWTEQVGYYADVEAGSASEARAMLENGEDLDDSGTCGFCEVETDSIQITSACTECGEPVGDRHNGHCGRRYGMPEVVMPEDCKAVEDDA